MSFGTAGSLAFLSLLAGFGCTQLNRMTIPIDDDAAAGAAPDASMPVALADAANESSAAAPDAPMIATPPPTPDAGSRAIGASDGLTVTRIASGAIHSCVALSDGSTRCWGDNSAGQFGNASTLGGPVATRGGLEQVVELAAGGFHTCAIVTDGTVRCAGSNDQGQLGNGTGNSSTTPVEVPGIRDATAIAAGERFTCAIVTDGAVRCWGSIEPGAQTILSAPTPVAIAGVTGATALAAKYLNACVVVQDRSVRCWGYNARGQLGDGTATSSLASVLAKGVAGAEIVTVGYDHSCARISDGGVWCWGANNVGQLGDGTTANMTTAPVKVVGFTGPTAFATGSSWTCGFGADGIPRCWGNNPNGELGIATTTTFSARPVQTSGTGTVRALSAGQGGFTCAVDDGRRVRCWGSIRLADGGAVVGPTPTIVSGI